MKSIAYGLLASTALVMACFAPDPANRVLASITGGIAFALLYCEKD